MPKLLQKEGGTVIKEKVSQYKSLHKVLYVPTKIKKEKYYVRHHEKLHKYYKTNTRSHIKVQANTIVRE